jgi:hypothetical protein
MNRDNRSIFTETRRVKVKRKLSAQGRVWNTSPREASGAEIAVIAHAEGWLTPPMDITRVRLRPWQQTVFWGLRIYIGIMLVIMTWGFFHITGG